MKKNKNKKQTDLELQMRTNDHLILKCRNKNKAPEMNFFWSPRTANGSLREISPCQGKCYCQRLHYLQFLLIQGQLLRTFHKSRLTHHTNLELGSIYRRQYCLIFSNTTRYLSHQQQRDSSFQYQILISLYYPLTGFLLRTFMIQNGLWLLKLLTSQQKVIRKLVAGIFFLKKESIFYLNTNTWVLHELSSLFFLQLVQYNKIEFLKCSFGVSLAQGTDVSGWNPGSANYQTYHSGLNLSKPQFHDL